MNNNFYSSLNSFFIIKLYDTDFIIKIDDAFLTPPDNELNKLSRIHYHLTYEFFFTFEKGINVITIDSERFFSDCIVCIPPFLQHYSVANQRTNRFFFGFQKNNSVHKTKLYDKIEKYFTPENIQTFTFSDTTKALLTELNNVLHKNCFQKEYRCKQILMLIIFAIIDEAAVKSDASIESDSAVPYFDYEHIIDTIINNEYDKDINLPYIANKLHLSTKQTSLIIKKHFHCSVPKLILNKRLSIVCLLLTKTDMKISKIAELINFKTEANLFYTFKKEFGVTPLQYRKKRAHSQ